MRLIVSGSLALLLALAGCGTNEGTSTPPPDAGQATTPVEATTSAEPQPEGTQVEQVNTMPHMSRLLMTSGNYKAQVTILQGDLQRAEQGMVNGDLSLDGACPVNPQTDAVLPYAIQLTNLTEGFYVPYVIGWRVSREQADNGGQFFGRVQIGESFMFGSTPMCEMENEHTVVMSSMQTRGSLGTNSFVETKGFLVVRRYYNPDHPEGDAEAARHVVLEIMSLIANNSRDLKGKSSEGEMHKIVDSSFYGVSFIPAEAGKNCLLHEKLECPSV